LKEFDFTTSVEDTKWLVDGLIPLGHLCFVLAKAGVGKSLLIESLAIHVINNAKFADMKTVSGDVLIIDQDTTEGALTKRLIQMDAAIEKNGNKHKLFVESMRGYSLDNNTLMTVIHDHPSVKLTIIDSFHSVCGKLNPNYTTDMGVLARMKSKCLTGENNIIFNHHISQKEELSLELLMTGEPGRLAMGSSAIIQQADSYYIVGATAVDGRTEKIYMRPVAKRATISSKPIVLRLIETEYGEKVVYDGFYTPGVDDIQQDLMSLFREQSDVERTVKEVHEATGHRFTENDVRKALASLDKLGFLTLSKSKSNLFKYRLP
jgi:RecA-family ATPase